MYVVIFRAQAQALDADYAAMARQLRQLALDHYGCLEFASVSEGDSEIALLLARRKLNPQLETGQRAPAGAAIRLRLC